MSGGNIKVVVRCRPLNSRELARGAKGLIQMEGSQTTIEAPQAEDGHASNRSAGKKPQTFSFDKSYWSAGKRDDPDYASQKTLYDDLGVELLDHSFEGFNTCIFAYGQTGSGKSYSMMGYGADKGIIPLTTSELFRRVETRSATEKDLSYSVEVSYIEIYNEKVRDLLNPKNKDNLRVREHPSLGPYVEDLSRLVVEDYSQMMTLMDEGNKARTVASTNMNETSSRSHAVFTVILTQKRLDPVTNMVGEKVSKISLVDLAGSERQASTGATGARLREGSNINKSLTTLGKVIAALAQASETVKGKKKKEDFVPYRDSVLTWLLKESLGGNSKTAMIAAISPADYEETLSTLRYADAAKRIKTHAVVNEDPNAKLIRELKEELELLRSRVSGSPGTGNEESTYDPSVPADKQIVTYRTKDGEIKQVTKLELQDQLQASEKLMESLNLTWEEKMTKTAAIHIEREKALEELGISIDKDVVGVHAPQKHPSLVNLNEDPLMSECLVYQLKPGTTIAGALGGETAHVRLSGSHILDTHCIFTNNDGKVTVEALADARTFVNGKRVPPNEAIKLLNGYRVILGDFHVFRYNDPQAVRLERQRLSGTPGRSDSPSKTNDEFMDWSAARREVADIEKLGDQDLDKLYDDIVKVRIQRRKTDSRMDLAADFESRLTNSQTDEPLEPIGNPWAGPMETTTTERESIHTPLGDEHDIPFIDQRSDTEAYHSLGPAIKLHSEDSSFQQEHLTRQLKSLAQEVKRIRSQAAASRALEKDIVETASWSSRELKLVQGAVKRWRGIRSFKMAEQVLQGAVDIKEANVIARTLGRNVSYNFMIGDDGGGHPSSSRDARGHVADLEDVGETLPHIQGPGLLVKVLDRKANSVYTWDYARFHQQLVKMRHVRALKQRPNYSQHFRDEGTFTNPLPPTYAFVGMVKAPLRLLANRVSHDVTLPIICPYTMEAIGSCRVAFTLSSSGSSGVMTPESSSRPLKGNVPIGQRYSFDLLLNNVRGISSSAFSSFHAQVRLSSLVGEDIASDDIFISPSVDASKTSHLALRKTITVLVTPSKVEHMNDGYANFEFYAALQPQYLERLDRWDTSREAASPLVRSPQGSRPAMRRCETDFLGQEHHDILTTVTISELSSGGTYEPVEVIDDAFQLHQGVQRRLGIRVDHSSGKSFSWTSIDHVTVSDIRTKAKDQIVTVNEQEVGLNVTCGEASHAPDGTSTLSAAGPWDTAAHGSIHLDRRTRSDQTIIVRLTFLINVESLHEPASFSLDLPLRILPRDSRRSSLMSYFSSDRIYTSLTAVYAVELVPPIAQSTQDLWRLDTAKKHVPGEEVLGEWKPRGASLLEDWQRARKSAKGIADKQITGVVLDLLGDLGSVDNSPKEPEALLRESLGLWQQHMDQRYLINLESPDDEAVSRKLRKLMPELETKLVPHVKLVPKVDNIIKQGTMAILRDSQANQWIKLYFVLQRPYLHIHPTHTERTCQIINLQKANITPSPDVEALLGHRFAFTIFTPTNSYVLQAPNQKELNDWMRVIITSAG